jgi:hypothetical protein
MDRVTAAGVLGVPPGASSRRLTKAYRARVRSTHPDRFPPGSEAWEDANAALVRLNEAVRVLGLPPGPDDVAAAPSATSASGETYDAVPSWERSSEGFRSPRDTDRMARAWGYAWGAFLIASAVACWFVGSTGPVNDAVPLWSPALAVIGVVAIAIGWRADRRLRRE